jgi:hypothetical protein
MDFIERTLHIAPDGGNGTFEAAILIASVVVVGFLVFRKRIAQLVGPRRSH